MLNSSITQLVIGTAVAVGISVVAISAVAQPPAEPTQAVAQESLLRTAMVLHRRKQTSGSVIIRSLSSIFLMGGSDDLRRSERE